MKLRKILIAGAGIGGLTLGVALRRLGFEVEIYEKASNLLPIGFGLAIAPNAALALRHINLDRAVVQAGHVIRQGQIKTATGKTLKEVPLGELEARIGGSVVAINRGRLHQVLRTAFDESHLHLNSMVTGFKESDQQVALILENGQEIEGDLLIGADGIHSAVRRQLFPNSSMRYSGYTCWRGLCSAGNLLEENVSTYMLGRGARFSCTPLGDGNLYWYVTYFAPENQAITQSPQSFLLQRYQNWSSPVSDIIASTPDTSILHTDIYDADPLTTWSGQRVSLVGDAAHPMTPDMGQGACQAIEDAIILAKVLYDSSTIEEALQAYEACRIPRTSKIVLQSRQVGQLEQTANPLVCSLRNALYSLLPIEFLLKQTVNISKFDLSADGAG